MSDTPAPRPPVSPHSVLEGLGGQGTDEQIHSLDQLLDELTRRLSHAQS